MISGNKGFKKQVVSKSHTLKTTTQFRASVNSRRKKKKGSTFPGVPLLPVAKLEALLHGQDSVTIATRERDAALAAERAATREQHEAERQAIREAALLEEQRIKYQKEIEMADMQTELSKVIDSWDDEPATDNTIPEVLQMGNKSRATTTQIVFDRIRDNPGYVRGYYVSTLGAEGLNSGTVGSVITKLSMQGLIAMANDRGLSVTRKTYAPMYGKPPRAARRSAAHGIPTSVPEARAPLIPFAAEEWTVESVVDKLNIRQARAVYNELRTLLGED